MKFAALILVLLGSQPVFSQSLVRDGSGRIVGSYLGVSESEYSRELAVSERGYRFAFDRTNGQYHIPAGISNVAASVPVFFTTADCTGTAYVSVASGWGNSRKIPGFLVPAAVDYGDPISLAAAPVFYLPHQAPSSVVVQRRSWFNYTGAAPATLSCQTSAPDQPAPAYPLTPNDSGETGLPNGRIPGPIEISGNGLFRDGFELQI